MTVTGLEVSQGHDVSKPPGTSTGSEPITRAASIEEPSNALVFQPLSQRLAPMLVRLGVSANATSLIGMACGIAGASLYALPHSIGLVLAGFALMCAWHVMDGADGLVARMTGTQSNLGKLIDGLCDYAVFVAAYVLLAMVLDTRFPGLAWPLAVAAGVCHAIQAGGYEAQRQMFDYWALGKESARLGKNVRQPPRTVGEAALYLYEWIQLQITAITPDYLTALEQRIGTPGRDNPHSAAYADMFAGPVRRWGIMCPNYRTYGIFLACLFDHPEAYFLAEIVLLGPAYLALIIWQRGLNRAFIAR